MDASEQHIPEGATIVLAGGGSGGHLYPGLAVAEALVAQRPDVKPLFLCTDREIDRVILEPTGVEYVPQPIVPPRKSVGGILRFWQAWRATNDLVKRLLDERQPAAVLGLGGYAAGVAVKVAGKRGIPAAILNPDVVPGRANLYLMPSCRRVYAGYEATLEHVPAEHRERCLVTGCPLRKNARPPVDRAEAAKRLGLDPRLSTLVITGASQGAQTINEAVIAVVTDLLKPSDKALQGWQVLHLAGREHAEEVKAAWRDLDLNGRASVIDFTPSMGDVWAAADLAISRSGAGSCAELAAFGVPSILMPYPFHKDMHQAVNGKVLADAGAAVLLDDRREKAANAAALKPILEALLYDSDRRDAMREAAADVAYVDAADRVATDLLALA